MTGILWVDLWLTGEGEIEPFVYTKGAGSSSLSPPNTDGQLLSEERGFHFWGRKNGVSSIHVLFRKGNVEPHSVIEGNQWKWLDAYCSVFSSRVCGL